MNIVNVFLGDPDGTLSAVEKSSGGVVVPVTDALNWQRSDATILEFAPTVPPTPNNTSVLAHYLAVGTCIVTVNDPALGGDGPTDQYQINVQEPVAASISLSFTPGS